MELDDSDVVCYLIFSAFLSEFFCYEHVFLRFIYGKPSRIIQRTLLIELLYTSTTVVLVYKTTDAVVQSSHGNCASACVARGRCFVHSVPLASGEGAQRQEIR